MEVCYVCGQSGTPAEPLTEVECVECSTLEKTHAKCVEDFDHECEEVDEEELDDDE